MMLYLLKGFGSWKNICDMRCQPVKHMQVDYYALLLLSVIVTDSIVLVRVFPCAHDNS